MQFLLTSLLVNVILYAVFCHLVLGNLSNFSFQCQHIVVSTQWGTTVEFKPYLLILRIHFQFLILEILLLILVNESITFLILENEPLILTVNS